MIIFDALDQDVANTLAEFRCMGRRPFEEMGVRAAREIYRAGRSTTQILPLPVASVADLYIGGARRFTLRFYKPEATAKDVSGAAILFFHGGGWVIGDLDTHDSICRMLAISSGRTVISVDYRLAPEHRFPAAVKDALEAFDYVVSQSPALKLDPANIAVAGDSAGGSLAAVVAHYAMLHGQVKPIAQLLFYPVTDMRGCTESYRRVKGVPITAATMHWFRKLYLKRDTDAGDWRVSPLLVDDHTQFPATFITTAGHDPLCDEGIQFACGLRVAGVTVEHRHLPGQIHGYLTLGRKISEAARSIEAAADFLRRPTSVGLDHT